MAANTYGLTSITFGTVGLSGYVVQDSSVASTPQVVAEVFDITGARAHVRYDDVTDELTLNAVLQGATLPTPGAVFTYNGANYETVSVEKKQANKDFVKVTIKGKKSAGITVS